MKKCLAVFAAILLGAATWVPANAAPLSHDQALRQLSSRKAEARHTAVQRLAELGLMRDVASLTRLLFDKDEEVRAATEAALWKVWSRSGDARIDGLYQKGVEQMNGGEAGAAVATFTEIIRLKPDFAEGWNKRATVLFFMGRYQESLADCDEVMKRNPRHFGALAGYGQIHSRLENYDKALAYFERALAINPNMEGVAVNVVALRKLLAGRSKRAI